MTPDAGPLADAAARWLSPGPAAITVGDVLPTLPFVALLLAIAVLPLIHATAHWWEHNGSKLAVAGGLALLTVAWTAWKADPVHGVPQLFEHAVLGEYIPFITLLFGLYTVCGGLRLSGRLPATPAVNTAFLAVGAGIASFVGTTGASMLLIRPLLEINSGRTRVVHTVVFFIFLVSNIGGTLLPIGDPPLFLGYLRGVPFLWTFTLWQEWAFCVVVLLAIYYVWDRVAWARDRREGDASATPPDQPGSDEPLRLEGLQNLAWLGLLILAVGTLDGGPHPTRPIPLLGWATPPFLREVAVLALTALAWVTTSPDLRSRNRFNFTAILEVAALFIGIFITMQPALHLLSHHAGDLGVRTPAQFFWATGALSSFLDNAPTYVVFFEAAGGILPVPEAERLATLHAGEGQPLLAAVSMGAVFMGANTYIGNGPNFMVKSIAEQYRVPMPGFFGYMVYSAAVLVPLFVAVMLLFL